MILRKKRFFTLLETMIALALLSVLITFLLGFYWEIEAIHSELGKVRRDNFRLLYVQNRLKDVISQAALTYKNQPELLDTRKFLFYTSKDSSGSLKENSLVLIYNNGIANPNFSQNVLGRIYLDHEDRLCLATWPQPKKWLDDGHLLEFSPLNKEILLENVSSLSFEFYMPPDKAHEKIVDRDEVGKGKEVTKPQRNFWHPEWLLSHDTLPAMAKVMIKQKATSGTKLTEHVFIVPLISFNEPVIYIK